jgi:lipoprotein-anchoring transpeptidase ErfK/SrfK
MGPFRRAAGDIEDRAMRAALRSLVVLFALQAMALPVPAQEGQVAAVSTEPQAEGALPPAEQATEQPPQPSEHAVAPSQAPAQPSAEEQKPAAKIDLSGYAPGTIVVETSERKLHLVLGNGEVITYPVGVGKSGRTWAGTGAIAGKYLRPAWSPPKALHRVKPWLPDYIPGGSPKNPMGAAAMPLTIDQYAIHGTNDPSSIGGFVSFGCIRMHNQDVLDLYKRVHVGTKVVVLR